MKNSNNTIGNGTYDLPACIAVPQPTALDTYRHLTSSTAFEAGTSLNNAHKAIPASQYEMLIVRNNPSMLYRDPITPYCVGIMQVILVLWHVVKAKVKLTILTPLKEVYGRGKYSYKHSEFFTMQRVVQRSATVLYELKCIQQEAEFDSAERFHLVHYKVQCLIAIYLFIYFSSRIYLFYLFI
jgi:hypothetical protein